MHVMMQFTFFPKMGRAELRGGTTTMVTSPHFFVIYTRTVAHLDLCTLGHGTLGLPYARATACYACHNTGPLNTGAVLQQDCCTLRPSYTGAFVHLGYCTPVLPYIAAVFHRGTLGLSNPVARQENSNRAVIHWGCHTQGALGLPYNGDATH